MTASDDEDEEDGGVEAAALLARRQLKIPPAQCRDGSSTQPSHLVRSWRYRSSGA